MVDGLVKKYYRRQTIIQICVAIAIFGSGIIAGFGGTVYILKSKGILRPTEPPLASKIASKIGKDYELSAEQIKQVEQIFEKAGSYLEEVRQEIDAKLEIGKGQIFIEMKSVLPPEKYERWQEDFNALHQKSLPISLLVFCSS